MEDTTAQGKVWLCGESEELKPALRYVDKRFWIGLWEGWRGKVDVVWL